MWTNHSLRVVSTTRMFSRVLEKLIADKTGHYSIQSLRSCKRTQPEIEKIIDSFKSRTFFSIETRPHTDSHYIQSFENNHASCSLHSDFVPEQKCPVRSQSSVPKPSEHAFSGAGTVPCITVLD